MQYTEKMLEARDELIKRGHNAFVTNLADPFVGKKEIAKPWLETPIDFDKVEQHTKKFFAVFSDDDEVVPQENKKLFEERLGAKTAIEHNRGHFSGSDEVKELPVILEAILSQ